MATGDTSATSAENVKRLCEDGRLQDAIFLVQRMDRPAPSAVFYELINWSTRYKNLSAGRNIQRLIIENGLEADDFLGNNLIRMFGLCGSLPEVNQVFSKLCQPNAMTWSFMIAAFANLGHIDTALLLCKFCKFMSDYVLTSMLKACSNICASWQGKRVHDLAIRSGLDSMTVVANALIDMYFKCGSGGDARKVFDNLTGRDVVTWTATLAGYVQLKDGVAALQIFEWMCHSDTRPNRVTYTSVLRACACLDSPHDGRLIHSELTEQSFDQVTVIGNSLIDMYAKCNILNDGLAVFRHLANKNLVSWTVVLEAYIQDTTDDTKVMKVVQQMLKEGWKPDNVLFLNLLKACDNVLSFVDFRLLHTYGVENGLELDSSVSSSLVHFYVNYGSIDDAFRLYSMFSSKSLAMYTTIIAGLVEVGRDEEAIELFWILQREGLEPDSVSFIGVLKACSNSAKVIDGRIIHSQIIEARLDDGDKVGSALVEFYSKSGSLMDACRMLYVSSCADAVGWTSMIAGYVEGHEYTLALQCFKEMQKTGIQPDEVTCICMLSAFARLGLVDEGCHFFVSMREVYDITPGLDHADCVANLLGHAGFVTTAESLLQTLPYADKSTCWISLLGHCNSCGSFEVGEECFVHSS